MVPSQGLWRRLIRNSTQSAEMGFSRSVGDCRPTWFGRKRDEDIRAELEIYWIDDKLNVYGHHWAEHMQRINERMIIYIYSERGDGKTRFFLKPKQVRQEDERDNKESRHFVPHLKINGHRYLEMVKTMMCNLLRHSGFVPNALTLIKHCILSTECMFHIKNDFSTKQH
jgi:hypothetical protein